VKITVVSEQGKEAVIAILGANEFFGEGSLAGQVQRIASVATMTDSVIVRLEKAAIVRVIHQDQRSPRCSSPSYVDGPPWQALFWRFERFGRLRSYVRPVDAEHMSAGLDGVRLSGSLSCERALRSWGVAGCS